MNNKSVLAAAIAAISVVAFASSFRGQGSNGQSCCPMMAGGQGHEDHHSAATAQVQKGVQKVTITVDNGKYSPSTINVKKGKPVTLTFKLGKSAGCGDVLVIEKFGIKQDLAKNSTATFTPNKAGTYTFMCGMGMIRGKIVVK